MSSCYLLPFVSVIIPAFNEERYIEACLSSVLALDWPRDRMEVLVVDNGSTDSTREIAGRLLSAAGCGRILEKIGGTIAAVRNHGRQHAKGDLLAFLDGDSVVQPEWIRSAVLIFSNNIKAVCIGFAMKEPDVNASWIEKTWSEVGNSSRHKTSSKVEWLCSFNLFVKKEFFDLVMGFSETMSTGEDYDFCKKIGKYGDILFSVDSKVVHLGNVKSGFELFRKEVWRGWSVFDLRWEMKTADILSIVFPFIYIVFIIVGGLLWAFSGFGLARSLLVLIGAFFPPVLMSLRRGLFGRKVFRGAAFYLIYLLARGVAGFGRGRRAKEPLSAEG